MSETRLNEFLAEKQLDELEHKYSLGGHTPVSFAEWREFFALVRNNRIDEDTAITVVLFYVVSVCMLGLLFLAVSIPLFWLWLLLQLF